MFVHCTRNIWIGPLLLNNIITFWGGSDIEFYFWEWISIEKKQEEEGGGSSFIIQDR